MSRLKHLAPKLGPSFWLATVVLLVVLAPRVTTLSGTFITNDETLFWQWSNEFFTALARMDWYGTLVGKGYPYITVAWVHSIGLV